MIKKFLIYSFAIFSIFANATFAQIKFSTDFIGGNGVLEKIENNEIWLHQDQRDTKDWWFYWSFQLSDVANKELLVHLTSGDPITTNGVAYSFDEGATWKWLGKDACTINKEKKGASFKHKIPSNINTVRYCFTFPYYLENFLEFTEKLKSQKFTDFKIEDLATTKGGKKNICVRFGKKDSKIKFILAARHHACESTASYVLEGILEEALSNSDTGKFLRENADFFVVPFTDLDGVQSGDQGKSRLPHDHNRDYIENPIYPSVAAIMKECKNTKLDSKIIAIDFHCPGRRESKAYFYYTKDERITANIEALATILEKRASSKKGLIYYKKDDGRFGAKSYNKEIRPMFKDWISFLPNTDISTTFEFPYADTKGVDVTDKSAHAFGQTFAEALAEYISSKNN